MAARLSRTLLSTQQVVDLLDDGEEADFEMDDCFFPGSDDELGFEEVELEEDDTVYGNSIMKYSYYLLLLNFSESEGDGHGNNSSPDNSDIDESESSDVRCVHT